MMGWRKLRAAHPDLFTAGVRLIGQPEATEDETVCSWIAEDIAELEASHVHPLVEPVAVGGDVEMAPANDDGIPLVRRVAAPAAQERPAKKAAAAKVRRPPC